MCVCAFVVHWHRAESAGKLNISGERFQAWSTMKVQLCDASGAVHNNS